MRLPSTYHFPEPTLLLVTDRMQAKIFRMYLDELLPITELHADGYPLDDTEKYSIKVYGTVHAGGEDEHIRERVGASFFHDLARTLHDRCLRGEFAQIIIAVPQEYRNALLQSLSPDVTALVCCVLPQELIHEHPLNILARVYERER